MIDKEAIEGQLSEDTAAAASIKTKSASMADIVSKMQGMSHDDITKLSDVINQVGHEADSLPAAANAEANKNSIKAMKEDLAIIFGKDNQELSESFIEEISTLFEAAVNMRVSIEREKMFEEASEVVEEMVQSELQTIQEGIDNYLEEAVNDWKEENKLAIESSVRLNQFESFMEGLRGLFLEHAVDVPEENLDLVEALSEEIEELKEKLNEALNENIEHKKIIEAAQEEMAFDEISEGLAATQIEKLRTLTEDLSYNDLNDYKKKVLLVRESTFGKTDKVISTLITEDQLSDKPEEIKPVTSVSHYADAISKSVKNR